LVRLKLTGDQRSNLKTNSCKHVQLGQKDCRMSIAEISSFKNKYNETPYKFTELQ